MGNVQTTGPNQAIYISGGVPRESSPDYVCCRRVLRLHLQEDGGGGLGLGLVAGHRRPEVQYHTKLPPRLLDYKLQNKEFTLKPFTSLHRSSLVRFKTLLNFIKSFLYQRNFQLNLNVKTLSCISLYLLQIVTGGDDSKPHL